MKLQNTLSKRSLHIVHSKTTSMDIIKYICLVIICRLLLDAVYSSSISIAFDYARMVNERTIASSITSWVVLAILTVFTIPFALGKRDEFVSSFVLVLFIMRVIPFTSFIQYSPQPLEFVILSVFYWILLFTLLGFKHKGMNVKIPIKENDGVIMIISIIMMLAVVITSGVNTGFRLHFSLEDVYDLREEARGYTGPVLLSYLVSATGNIIPVLVVYYIIKKNKAMVALLAFIGFLNFGIAGQKSTIFKILACVAMIFFTKVDLRKHLLPFTVVFLLLTQFLYIQFDNPALSWVFVRRMFYTPNLIDTFYYEYISQNGPLFFDSQASGELAFQISEDFINREGNRANNGLFSDAFVNLGVLGILIMPILISFLVRFYNNVLRGQNKSIVVFTSIIVATTLNGSFLTRSLLTHGLFLLLVTLAFMPKVENGFSSRKITNGITNR